MTQMLLFDAPVGLADSALVGVAESAAAVAAKPSRPQASSPSVCPQRPSSQFSSSQFSSSQCPSAQRSSTERQADNNLHHMGDLARLVLLRYDLLAKRREQMASRRAKRLAK